MKIVKKSNFNLDVYREVVVAENVSEFYGKELVDAWKKEHWLGHSLDYLELVEDDYVPYDGYKELYGE